VTLRLVWTLAALAGLARAGELETARDAQNRAVLERLAGQYATRASSSKDPQAQYLAALAQSYIAEVAIETGEKDRARAAAGEGIEYARKAAAAKPDSAEYHRLLGSLCGQMIPANVVAGLRWGGCARDEIGKAVQLDPHAAINYVSRGVGFYYLPPLFGGGAAKAIADFEKAIELDPKLDEAHLWLGIALRKSGRNPEARRELQKAIDLNPERVWSRIQLEKTPR
jgi:tetratricopeptide (TPR) repeat protein